MMRNIDIKKLEDKNAKKEYKLEELLSQSQTHKSLNSSQQK